MHDSVQLLSIHFVTFDIVLDSENCSKFRMCSQHSNMGLPVVFFFDLEFVDASHQQDTD